MRGPTSDRDDAILARLRQEFLVDARERLDNLQQALEAMCAGGDATEALTAMRRETHNLKGLGSAFGFPTISLIAHRFEDYLQDLGPGRRSHTELQPFLDRLDALVTAGVDPGLDQASGLVRSLPASVHRAIETTPPRQVEVLLVAASKAIGKIVARELAACGYRVTIARTPWEAFELAVCMRPDLLITSVVLDRVSGVDLACAFAAIPATRHMPVAVLTSFDGGQHELARLPAGVGVVRLGQHLREDLAAMIYSFEETAHSRAAPAARCARKHRLLLVDDDRVIQQLVTYMLQREGYCVELADCGRVAIEAMRETPYDLVLMDILMPDMDGVETVQRIRALAGAAGRVPVIALTGNERPDQVAGYLAAGMNDHVAKPIEATDLLAAIRRQTGAAGPTAPATVGPGFAEASAAAAAAGPDAEARAAIGSLLDSIGALDKSAMS
ncbi:MAG TPA: response regulator [Dongiaceae bacterium]|nr:response regulator [Dongiaceae bacterium]